MKYRITLSNSALRFYDSLNAIARKQIDDAVKDLLSYYEHGTPINIDLSKMHDEKKYSGCFRLRTGSYRIVFIPKRTELVIFVLNMDKRQDIYKKS